MLKVTGSFGVTIILRDARLQSPQSTVLFAGNPGSEEGSGSGQEIHVLLLLLLHVMS